MTSIEPLYKPSRTIERDTNRKLIKNEAKSLYQEIQIRAREKVKSRLDEITIRKLREVL